MKTINNRSRGQRGTQIVELAVVLPLLAFLALVVTEGATFIRVHQILNNAAREGAHLSSLPENNPYSGDHTAGITQAVVDYAANNGITITASNVTVNQTSLVPTPSGISINVSRVTVTLTYTLKYLPKLPFFGVQGTVPLTGAAEFRNLY